MKKTTEMPWSERAAIMGWSTNKKATDLIGRREAFVVRARALMAAGLEPFEFSDDIERLAKSLQWQDGYWCGEHRGGRFAQIPEAFRHLI